MFYILGIIVVFFIFRFIANFCDKHNIEIPCSDDHPEWYDD